MQPWSADWSGELNEHVVASDALRDNPLGDPADRPLWVYTPPGYADEPDRRYPSVYVIRGYTGHVAMWRNRTPFRQPFPERADALFAAGAAPPAIVVYVDAWTAYGGSQFVDSAGTGRYHTYLCDEVVPYVDARYRTLTDAAHRDGDVFEWWDEFRSRTAFTKQGAAARHSRHVTTARQSCRSIRAQVCWTRTSGDAGSTGTPSTQATAASTTGTRSPSPTSPRRSHPRSST